MRRVERYPFGVVVELTSLESAVALRARTTDIGLFGCGIDDWHPLGIGTRVHLKLVENGREMSALARVVYAEPDLGIGIAFTSMDPASERTLGEWLTKLAESSEPVQPATTEAIDYNYETASASL